MIPKIIHYCWFGGEKPQKVVKCIESWKKNLPDYEIKEWNKNNFDISELQYTLDAYKAHKYAFVSDVARVKALYEYGGIYLDTDVMVYKSLILFYVISVCLDLKKNSMLQRVLWLANRNIL